MKFRLQKILDVREIVEKQKQKDFSLVMQQLQNEKDNLNALIEKRSSFTDEMQFKSKITVRGVADHHNYLDTLTRAVSYKTGEISQIEKKVDKKRQVLLKATTDRKSIEKLREKAQEEFLKEESAAQQALIDEIAMRKIKSEKVI